MRSKWFIAGVFTAAGFLVWAAPSRAGDTLLLNRLENAPTQNLVDDGKGADTVRTWYRGFGFGGYRGFGYGGYRGFGYGGYRGFGLGGYRGFYRPYYGLGFYRPYYGFGFGRGLGYGLGYGLGLGSGFGLGYGLGYGGGFGGFGGGFYPGFGIGYGGGYYGGGYGGFYGPCSGLSANVTTLAIPATALTPTTGPAAEINPPIMPREDGTYPYDGGPANPNAEPKPNPTPTKETPRRTVPLEGRSVSLPAPAKKWSYPAYGETARRVPVVEDRTYYTKSEAGASKAR